jgi:hypothetical protein
MDSSPVRTSQPSHNEASVLESRKRAEELMAMLGSYDPYATDAKSLELGSMIRSAFAPGNSQ